jgi:glycosyltransferase involved in cell wall biosynthesis
LVFAFLDFGRGGAQRATLALARHLDRDRFVPTLLCVRGDGALVAEAEAAGIAVSRLGRLRRAWDLRAPARIAAELRRLDARILHVPLYSRASPYLRLAARRARTPLVVAHEWSRPDPPRLARRLADRWLRRGTRFVAASAVEAANLRRSGVAERDLALVHSGIELARFASGERAVERAALGLDGRIAVLVPARLHAAKGHLDLLDAVPGALARAPELVWLLAGDGPERERLAAAIRDRGLENHVRLLGWRENVADLLAASDFVALPSRVEGLPGAMLEAFAAGRAVVATDVGGVGEALTDGVEGRLVPARSPSRLAEAMAELALAPELREAMAERGRRSASRFDVRATARRFEELYERWMRERPAGERP